MEALTACWLLLFKLLAVTTAAGAGPSDSMPPAGSAGFRTIPWNYKGYDSFPTNWFGANPTGGLGGPGESNVTLEVMARHHLVVRLLPLPSRPHPRVAACCVTYASVETACVRARAAGLGLAAGDVRHPVLGEHRAAVCR
jgi:hypothetical protein